MNNTGSLPANRYAQYWFTTCKQVYTILVHYLQTSMDNTGSLPANRYSIILVHYLQTGMNNTGSLPANRYE